MNKWSQATMQIEMEDEMNTILNATAYEWGCVGMAYMPNDSQFC